MAQLRLLRSTPARTSVYGRSAARMHVKCIRKKLPLHPTELYGQTLPVRGPRTRYENLRHYIFPRTVISYLAAGVMERVMGIEPTLSAWKAEVLPLNYTRLFNIGTQRKARRDYVRLLKTPPSLDRPPLTGGGGRIRTSEGVSRQIYNLIPLAAREPLQKYKPRIMREKRLLRQPLRGV